jgi:hypothetical protein
MRLCLALSGLLFLTTAGQAMEIRFMTEAEFKRQTTDMIPLRRAERVVASEKGYPVPVMVYMIGQPYAPVLPVVRHLAQTAFGEARYAEAVEGEYIKNWAFFSEDLKAQTQRDIARLQAKGINVRQFQTALLTTQPYNVLDANTHSLLEIRVVNGRDVFGVDCTLAVLRRTDTWRDWYREFHTGIPIPFKGQADLRLTTTPETDLMERVRASLGLTDLHAVFSFNPETIIGAPGVLEQIKDAIDGMGRSKTK